MYAIKLCSFTISTWGGTSRNKTQARHRSYAAVLSDILCHSSVVRKKITLSGPCVSYRFVEVHTVASAANAPEIVILGDHFPSVYMAPKTLIRCLQQMSAGRWLLFAMR